MHITKFLYISSTIGLIFLLVYILYLLKDNNEYFEDINKSVNEAKRQDKNPFFTCYVNMSDIDPLIIPTYMELDNKISKCGPCENALVRVQIDPCPTDINGIVNSKCSSQIRIYSSQDMPIQFKKYINPSNVKDFFCL